MVATRIAASAHAGLWHLAHTLWHLAYQWETAPADRPGAVLAGTAAVVAVLLAAVLAARLGRVPWRLAPASSGPAGAPAQRARRDGTPRYTDPDAPGRARPRAPCAAPRPRIAA
jgi:hypothetical protein